MRHEAWLVDLDGTLYASLPVRAAMALELAVGGWSSIATLRAFRAEHERLREEAPACSDPFSEQIARTARALGLPADVVDARVREWMIRRPGRWLPRFRRRTLVEEIRAFRAAGGRTALVSDYPARDKLRALGLEDAFEVVVASGEPGGPTRLKPSPDGLLAAARSLGVEPSRCLVIGDRDDADGAAARAAGMDFRLAGARRAAMRAADAAG